MGNGLHYHDDVANAFAVAGSVAAVISNCQVTAKTIIAHSLGNMVACSAFCDHGMEADRYIMLNAAVPAEAIDANAFNDSTNANPMVHHQWHGYEPRTWAAKWHELFAGNDDRSKLTWRGRFGPMLNKPAGFLSNFYSSGDEVLSLHTNVNGHGMVVVDAFSGSTPRHRDERRGAKPTCQASIVLIEWSMTKTMLKRTAWRQRSKPCVSVSHWHGQIDF